MAEREGGVPRGSSRTLGDPPWGLSLSAEEGPPENLEEVPRIWEGEGHWRSEILNPVNNDYWVTRVYKRLSELPFLLLGTLRTILIVVPP